MTQDSIIPLEGGCYVVPPRSLDMTWQGGLQWVRVMGAPEGALKISQFLMVQTNHDAPAIASVNRDTVLFILDGEGTVHIGDRQFGAVAGTGIHVRRGEAFCLESERGEVRYLMTCCPGISEPVFLADLPDTFDAAHPERTVAAEQGEKEATGDRFFKLLVGPDIGSCEVTQFIGMIPRSKAPEHFHLYEEAICVLRGTGRMWTGESSAPVGPGSMIFLPIRQPHCLECEDDDGMELVGIFYPAGSPAVNYAAT